MIVVIGSPILRASAAPDRGIAGLAGRVALAAAGADRSVQLVGKVGDDDAGDALLIALAAGGIGHATVLRDAAHATPVVAGTMPPADVSIEEALVADDFADTDGPRLPPGLALEAADVQLALRYLTDFRVVVIAMALDQATLACALDAAGFSGAHVIRLDGPGEHVGEAAPAGVEVTAFESPQHDEPAFAAMVGRYAAGLDAGRTALDAFSDATRGTNWERAASA